MWHFWQRTPRYHRMSALGHREIFNESHFHQKCRSLNCGKTYSTGCVVSRDPLDRACPIANEATLQRLQHQTRYTEPARTFEYGPHISNGVDHSPGSVDSSRLLLIPTCIATITSCLF